MKKPKRQCQIGKSLKHIIKQVRSFTSFQMVHTHILCFRRPNVETLFLTNSFFWLKCHKLATFAGLAKFAAPVVLRLHNLKLALFGPQRSDEKKKQDTWQWSRLSCFAERWRAVEVLTLQSLHSRYSNTGSGWDLGGFSDWFRVLLWTNCMWFWVSRGQIVAQVSLNVWENHQSIDTANLWLPPSNLSSWGDGGVSDAQLLAVHDASFAAWGLQRLRLYPVQAVCAETK